MFYEIGHLYFKVLPILNESGIPFEMELTNRANHGNFSLTEEFSDQ